MHGLGLAFNSLSICGVWMPLTWNNTTSVQFLYGIYSFFTVSGVYIMILLQILLLTFSKFDLLFSAEILYTLLASLALYIKSATFMIRRKKIIALIGMLNEKCCLPKDAEEFRMQKKTDNIIRKQTIIINTLAQFSLLIFLLTPLFQEKEKRKLPYEMWVPYDLHEDYNYWITYSLLILPFFLAVVMNITASNVVIGFIIQACNQFNFIKHRIHKLCKIVEHDINNGRHSNITIRNYELETLKQIAKHHNYIIQISKFLIKTFDVLLIEVYLASVLIISIIVYGIFLDKSSILYRIKSIGYLTCMIMEVLAYCWFGNELTLKSSNYGQNIYESNWMVLNKESNKILRFMMLRTSSPEILSFYGVINFNLISFMTIMKVTYSALNILRKIH